MTRQQFKALYLQCLDEAVAANPEAYVGDWRKESEEKRQAWAERFCLTLPVPDPRSADEHALTRELATRRARALLSLPL